MKVTIELDLAIAEDRAAFNALTANDAPAADTAEAEAPKPKKAAAKKQPTKKAESTPVADEVEDAADDEAEVSLVEVKEVATALVQAGKREELKAVLGEYEAESLSGVKPEDIPEFFAALKAIA